jgi:hypothetical protein
MPFDYDADYVEVDCKILSCTEKAVRIENEHGDKVWIPRSCIHGKDDLKVENCVGEDATIQIREWIADREGLI